MNTPGVTILSTILVEKTDEFPEHFLITYTIPPMDLQAKRGRPKNSRRRKPQWRITFEGETREFGNIAEITDHYKLPSRYFFKHVREGLISFTSDENRKFKDMVIEKL